jgi:hypothetical protein
VGDIKDTNRLSDGHMLVENTLGVMDRHFETGKGNEFGAQLLVD